MIHHPQFMPSSAQQATNNHKQPPQQHMQRTQNDSNSSTPQSADSSQNSMSTSSPQHQISSRVSPASTALVMSNNNISGQPNSRQLTPNTNSTGGNQSNGGTGSSTSTGHHHQHQANSGGANTNVGQNLQQHQHQQPPNPMARQFACHAKSMSAGVVVSVPGISNNLASAAGIHQNNMINHNIINSQAAAAMANAHQQQQQHHQHQQVANMTNHHQRSSHVQTTIGLSMGQQHIGATESGSANQKLSHNHHHHQHSRSANSSNQQQLILSNNNHNNLISSINGNGHRTLHHHSYSQQSNQTNHHHHHQNSYHHSEQQNGSSANFSNARQTIGSSSIVLSANTINNIHHRSASTQLSNVLLANSRGADTLHQSSSHHTSRSNFPAHPANSIWSIDENIGKSNGKLASSSYLPHPYLYNHSINDVSCDNVSNASRLMDPGAPAPSYYLHHHGTSNLNPNLDRNNPNGAIASTNSLQVAQFLPICDLLFNLISMIIYFCENTFNIIALIALYYHAPNKYWSLVGAIFVAASHIVCQPLSLKWIHKTKLEDCRRKREANEDVEDEEDCERQYYNRMAANMKNYPCGSCTWLPDGSTELQLKFLLSIALDVLLHLFCLGFLFRYIKLVIPVKDTARVKREARDLCVLRMIQAFIQSMPLLLLLTFMMGSQNITGSIINLCVVSTVLSLLNTCWALASYTKYARKKYMHKFVLTWLGIVSQLLWRLGTVSSRVAALSIYAVYYGYWMLVILALHWFTMFLWLFKPGNLLRDEVNMPRRKRFAFAIGTSWIYCFCYVNFEEHNSRAKIIFYYLIMFIENNLLFTVCQTFSTQVTWFKTISILVVYLGFVFGMLFMSLYYKYFHVTVLNNGLSCSQDSIDSIADQLSPAGKKIAGFKPGTLRLKSEDSLNSGQRYNSNINDLHTSSHPDLTKDVKPTFLTNNAHQASLSQSGVFSCKLNPDIKAQKMPKPHARRHN